MSAHVSFSMPTMVTFIFDCLSTNRIVYNTKMVVANANCFATILKHNIYLIPWAYFHGLQNYHKEYYSNCYITIIMQSDLKALNIYSACQVYSVECVSTIESILSIFFMQYRGLGVLGLTISLVMTMRIYVLYFTIIIKSEIWIISHYILQCSYIWCYV